MNVLKLYIQHLPFNKESACSESPKHVQQFKFPEQRDEELNKMCTWEWAQHHDLRAVLPSSHNVTSRSCGQTALLFGKQFAQSGLHLSLGLTKRRWRTAFERQTRWFVIPFRCEISSSMGDLTYLKNPKINSLCLLPPSHVVLATFLSYMFLKFICVLTGNKNDRKFLSDWVAQQDFSMTNEFFSLPQSFIIKTIVSPGRCTCAFKNCITFFPCTLQQTQLNSKHLWRLRKLVSAISW